MKNNVKKTVQKAVIIPVTASVLTIGMLSPAFLGTVQAENYDDLQTIVQHAKDNKKLKIKRLMSRSELMLFLNLTPEKLLELKKNNIPLKEYIEKSNMNLELTKERIKEKMIEKLKDKRDSGKISQERYESQMEKLDEKIDDWLNNHEKMFRWFGRR